MSETTGTKRVVVIGGGPGGYPAAFLAADLGLDVTLIDVKKDPGGVCLYQGCIPSKALLHVVRLLNESRESAAWGLTFDPPRIDLPKLRAWKEGVVGKLTGGLDVIRRKRGVKFVHGRARLLDATHVHVDLAGGETQTIEFDHAIVATGSRPATLGDMAPDSPRIMDSTTALALADIPGKLLVVGGGYIGLELGSVYAALGSKVTVVELAGGLLAGVDRDLVDLLHRRLAKRIEAVWTETKVIDMAETAGGIRVRLAGLRVEPAEQVFDKVLVAVGRRPNSDGLGLEKTGVQLDAKGFVKVDAQRRTAEPSIWAIGDVAGEPMLAHKATYEARIAVEAIAGKPVAFDPHAIPAVVFTDPEIAWCGLTETAAPTAGVPTKVARFPWLASGRATTLDRNDGLTKLVLEERTERVLGVGIAGVNAGEMIAEGVLAVEMGATASDLMMTIHAHPTLSETVMEAAEAYFGHSPHIYQKKKP